MKIVIIVLIFLGLFVCTFLFGMSIGYEKCRKEELQAERELRVQLDSLEESSAKIKGGNHEAPQSHHS